MFSTAFLIINNNINMLSNYINACRICLQEGSSTSINTKLDNLDITYYELIKTFIYPEISCVDNYPLNLCLQCIELLYSIHNLRTTLIKTEEKLKSLENVDILQKKSDTDLQLESDNISEISESSYILPLVSNYIDNTKRQEVGKARKIFNCEQCSRVFRRLEHLAVHKRIHTGERPFECSKCPKKFIQKATLVQHMRIHSGEKPFMCSTCGKSFSQSISLTYHFRIHTREKPFQCSFCDKRFIQKNNLNIHMRFHRNERPYKCEMCEKKFFTNSHLKIHIKQHLGKRDHACNVCHKRFLRSEHLKQHFNTHKGEKPHICEICSKAFSQKSHLTRHIKIHKEK